MSMSKEPAIRAELYRILSNAIKADISFGDYRISKVEVEFPVYRACTHAAYPKRADLVVFYQYKPRPVNHAFLVIETKRRLKYPATPLAKATKQVMNYAEKLDSVFFAVYDGWNFLLFERSSPYLIKLSNFHCIDESIAQNLLLGLLEFREKRYQAKALDLLPKVADSWSFSETILPTVAKSLEILEGYWSPIIDRDGEC